MAIVVSGCFVFLFPVFFYFLHGGEIPYASTGGPPVAEA